MALLVVVVLDQIYPGVTNNNAVMLTVGSRNPGDILNV